jgi:hypothetical protein
MTLSQEIAEDMDDVWYGARWAAQARVMEDNITQLETIINTKTAIMAGQQLYIARLEAQLDSLNRDVGKLLLLADLKKDIEELQ